MLVTNGGQSQANQCEANGEKTVPKYMAWG